MNKKFTILTSLIFFFAVFGLSLFYFRVSFKIDIDKNIIQASSCINECRYGEKACVNSNYYKVCGNFDDDPCTEWSGASYCGAGRICENGECVSQSSSCTNECSLGQTETRCSGNYLQERTCGNYDSDPCLEWSNWTTIQDCSAQGKVCQNRQCVLTCTNECSYGQKRCYDGVRYQTCGNYDSDPCLEWSSPITCSSGQICQGGECILTCTNECSYSGQKERRCYCGKYFQERTCGNYDSDPCLEWSSWTTIQDCGVSGWTSEYRCSGNIVQRKYINRGCSNLQCFATEEWKNVEDCSAQGKVCQNGQCVLTCTNECSYSGQTEKRCSGNYVQKRTCGNYDSDPCLEWSDWQNVENCGTSGFTDNYRCSFSRYLEREYINRGCFNAQCFASSEWRQVQDCGTDSWTENYRCSGNIVQREKIKRGCSNNSCYQNSVWENVEDCSAQGKVCQNGQCVFPPLTVSCSVSPDPALVGQLVTFSATASGGSGIYSYFWSGACSGNQRTCQNTFSSPGTYTAKIRVRSSDSQEKSASCSVTVNPIPCQCTPWSEWKDRGCGQGGCAQNQMLKERTRCCTPSGCAPESETRCIEDPRCQPNDPVTGTLSASSSTSPCVGEYVIFTIWAKDDQGVEKVCLNENCQSCNFQTTCTKTWQITKTSPGTFTFSGQVFGKKPDDSQESASTNPPSISVTWQDCNRPPVSNAGPDKEVLETQNVVLEGSGSDPDGDTITYNWVCSGGTLSNSNIAQPTFTAPAVSVDTTFTCTLTVTDSKGLSSSDSVNILVRAQTLFVTLEAIPNSGSAPLYNVDLKATVSGTAIGSITYKFDCTSDGTWERTITTNENPYLALDLCNYVSGGTFNAKVYVERGAADPAWAQATVSVSSPYPTVDLKVNNSDGPITIPYGSSVTLSWSSNNVSSCQAFGDWSGGKQVFGSEVISNIYSQKTFTLQCTGPSGTVSDSVTVFVSQNPFSVYLSASPSSGCQPLNNVTLTATVQRDFSGNLTYYFDCTSDGAFELIHTTSQNTFSATNLCNFPNLGTFYAKVKVEAPGRIAEASIPINVYSCYQQSAVDLKVNNSDGPITIPYGSSVTLSWSSNNVSSCQAFGDWSGGKSLSGSEVISNIYSQKTFTLQCTGPSGTVSDSVTVFVSSQPLPFSIAKHLKNVTKNTGWAKEIRAQPGDRISVAIGVRSGNYTINRVLIKDVFEDQSKILRVENLKLDKVPISGNVFEGIEVGPLSPNQIKTLTFDIILASSQNFPVETLTIKNTAEVQYDSSIVTDSAILIVEKREGMGVTFVPTGLLKNKFFDFILLPAFLSLILVFFFKPYLLALEGFGEIQRRKIREKIAQKLLEFKIWQYKIKNTFK